MKRVVWAVTLSAAALLIPAQAFAQKIFRRRSLRVGLVLVILVHQVDGQGRDGGSYRMEAASAQRGDLAMGGAGDDPSAAAGESGDDR